MECGNMGVWVCGGVMSTLHYSTSPFDFLQKSNRLAVEVLNGEA